MTSTRRAPPMEIFQDPVTSSEQNGVVEVESALFAALRPVTDVSAAQNNILKPTMPSSNGISPSKAPRKSDAHVQIFTESNLFSIGIPPPDHPAFHTDSPTKKILPPKAPLNFKPTKSQCAPFFSTFQSTPSLDKENIYNPSLYSDSFTGYSDPTYGYKYPKKRALSDAMPLNDRSNKRSKAPESEPAGPMAPQVASSDLPDVTDMPIIEDDGNKPPYSYATLIGFAILRTTNRRLTLSQIYKWIMDNFAYYRQPDKGWQNSIRHNLSLNKAFVKQDRPKDDPGKGNYWVIAPGMEQQFLKDRPGRRNTTSDGAPFIQTIHSDIIRPSTATAPGDLPVQPDISLTVDSSKFPEEPEASLTNIPSDGTVSNSDPAIHDGIDIYGRLPDGSHPNGRNIRSSPPPLDIQSSPPTMTRPIRDGTPPPVPRFPSNSRSGGRNRKAVGFGDSGYFSSLDSSVTRANARPLQLTSEVDFERPNLKRGRAEEEIARIRSSSYDSPIKNRAMLHPTPTMAFSSSPDRPYGNSFDAAPTHTPLTPPIVFKKPAKPPLSVSPNTNLRNHRNRVRELVGSPDKSLSVFGNEHLDVSLFDSPQFNFCTVEGDSAADNDDPFSIFARDDYGYRESPVRSAKRPRLIRSATTSDALAAVTGTIKKPFFSPTACFPADNAFFQTYGDMFEAPSPCKAGPTSTPMFNDMVTFDNHSDEGSDDAGIDLSKGFAKIGEKQEDKRNSALHAHK
ncbi:hypothetical protein M501DRAFT_929639 [Patellaria atrata CBS 101060]|uniref:Fork-head domain-containing protein n=1 Tax=Patellaria atrata CBS 101060 TaxID=1346257 RepID=A0A9P4SG11_9PEZI|nr:hypothetical protein M501DRAFT_929639 [Patellaria atrata CBS 101060]